MLHFWVCFVESTKIYLLGFAKHTHCVARLTVRFLSCHTSASGEHPVIGGGRESEVAGVRGFAKNLLAENGGAYCQGQHRYAAQGLAHYRVGQRLLCVQSTGMERVSFGLLRLF